MPRTRTEDALENRPYRDLLRAIASRLRRGKAVLVRDLIFDLKRPERTVRAQLDRLEEEGYTTESDGGASRIVYLTDKGRRAAARLGSPVLGYVPAGLLRAVPETDGRDAEGEQIYLETWDERLPPTEDYGVFQVRGDSMIGDCIQAGDEVQLRLGVKLHELRPGQIAAVHVGGDYEATLKHVFYDQKSGVVTLRASNRAYKDIKVPAKEVHVVGSFRGLVRLDPEEVNRK